MGIFDIENIIVELKMAFKYIDLGLESGIVAACQMKEQQTASM